MMNTRSMKKKKDALGKFERIPVDVVLEIISYISIDEFLKHRLFLISRKVLVQFESEGSRFWYDVFVQEMVITNMPSNVESSYCLAAKIHYVKMRKNVQSFIKHDSSVDWRLTAKGMITRRREIQNFIKKVVLNPMGIHVQDEPKRRDTGKRTTSYNRLTTCKRFWNTVGLGWKDVCESQEFESEFDVSFKIPWFGREEKLYEGSSNINATQKNADIVPLKLVSSGQRQIFNEKRRLNLKSSMKVFDNVVKSQDAYQSLVNILRDDLNVILQSKTEISKVVRASKEEVKKDVTIVKERIKGESIGIHIPIEKSTNFLLDETTCADLMARTPTIHQMYCENEKKAKSFWVMVSKSKEIKARIEAKGEEIDDFNQSDSNDDEEKSEKLSKEFQQLKEELNEFNRRKRTYIGSQEKIKNVRQDIQDRKNFLKKYSKTVEQFEAEISSLKILIEQSEVRADRMKINNRIAEERKLLSAHRRENKKQVTNTKNQLESLDKKLSFYRDEVKYYENFYEQKLSETTFLRRKRNSFEDEESDTDTEEEEESDGEEEVKVILDGGGEKVPLEDEDKKVGWDGDFDNPNVFTLEMGTVIRLTHDGSPRGKGFGSGKIQNENVGLVSACNVSNPDAVEAHEVTSLIFCKEGKKNFIGDEAEMATIGKDADDFFFNEETRTIRKFISYETLLKRLKRKKNITLLEYLKNERSSDRQSQGKLIQKVDLKRIRDLGGMFLDVICSGLYTADWKMLLLRLYNLGCHFNPHSTREKKERKTIDKNDEAPFCDEIFQNIPEYVRSGLIRSSQKLQFIKSIKVLYQRADSKLHGKTSYIRKQVHRLVILAKLIRMGTYVIGILRKYSLVAESVNVKDFSFGHSKARTFLKYQDIILKDIYEGKGGFTELKKKLDIEIGELVRKQQKNEIASRKESIEKITKKLGILHLLFQLKDVVWAGFLEYFRILDKEREHRKNSEEFSHEPIVIRGEYKDFDFLKNKLVPLIKRMEIVHRKLVQVTEVEAYYESYFYREYLVFLSKHFSDKENQTTPELMNMIMNCGYRRSSKWGGRASKEKEYLPIAGDLDSKAVVTRKIDTIIGVLARFRRIKGMKINRQKYFY